METRKINAAEQKALLAREEGHFLDLKSSRIAPAGLQKHFVAFANTDGGELYVGVEDAKVKGQRIIGFSKPEDANDPTLFVIRRRSDPRSRMTRPIRRG
jgi:ATP-dependent DNA helicase RecG